MKILQICPRVPYPPTDGGSIAMYQIYEGLKSTGHEITALCINTPKHYARKSDLESIGDFILVDVDTEVSKIRAALSYFNKVPYILSRFIHKSVEKKLVEVLSRNDYDIIQFEGTFTSPYIDIVRKFTKAKTVLRLHNLEYRIWENLALQSEGLEKVYFRKMSKGLQEFELLQFHKFDSVACISGVEEKELKPVLFNHLTTIEAGSEPKHDEAISAEPNTLFILGSMNWRPNLEAVNWFLEKVWDKVLQKHQEVQLHIAGTGMPEEVKNRKVKNVVFHGFVESADAFRGKFDIMLVPLLSGGGMRIKILEGFAQKKPVITTTKGIEGINVENKVHCEIVDNPDEWVAAIDRLLADESYKKQLQVHAYQLFLEDYHVNATVKKFEDLYMELLKS